MTLTLLYMDSVLKNTSETSLEATGKSLVLDKNLNIIHNVLTFVPASISSKYASLFLNVLLLFKTKKTMCTLYFDSTHKRKDRLSFRDTEREKGCCIGLFSQGGQRSGQITGWVP